MAGKSKPATNRIAGEYIAPTTVWHGLEQVWSGGQDGADIAGLRAAKACGVTTNGWMPLGWLTISGPRPEYEEMYGLSQHHSPLYIDRTYCNAIQTNASWIIGDNPSSRGSRVTREICERWNKPCINLTIRQLAAPGSVERARAWIVRHQIRKLNIAGNRDAPEDVIEAWLVEVFRRDDPSD